MACFMIFMMSTSLTAHVRSYPSVTNLLLHDPSHGTILFVDCEWDAFSMCCTLGLREQVSLQKIGHRLAGFCGNVQESCHLLPGDVESCESLSLPPQMAASRDGPSGTDDGSCTALLSSLAVCLCLAKSKEMCGLMCQHCQRI